MPPFPGQVLGYDGDLDIIYQRCFIQNGQQDSTDQVFGYADSTEISNPLDSNVNFGQMDHCNPANQDYDSLREETSQLSNSDKCFAYLGPTEANWAVNKNGFNEMWTEEALPMDWCSNELTGIFNQEDPRHWQPSAHNFLDAAHGDSVEGVYIAGLWNQESSNVTHQGELGQMADHDNSARIQGMSIGNQSLNNLEHVNPPVWNTGLHQNTLEVVPQSYSEGTMNPISFNQNSMDGDRGMPTYTGTDGVLLLGEPPHRTAPCQKKGKAGSKGGKGEKSRTLTVKWKDWKSHLYRIHMEQQQTAEELTFVMFAIHGLELARNTYEKRFSKWGEFRKNDKKQTKCQTPSIRQNNQEATHRHKAAPLSPGIRRRPATRLPPQARGWQSKGSLGSIQKMTGSSSFFSRKLIGQNSQLGPISSMPGKPYIQQELLFHSIDGLVKGLFGAGTKSWTAGDVNFVPPVEAVDNSTAWDLLSDQCSDIAALNKAGQYNQVNFLLDRVFGRLKATRRSCDPSLTRSCDPGFVVHIWKICLAFLDIRFRSRIRFPRFLFLGLLLRRLKNAFSASLGNHPLVDLLNCLIHVLAFSPQHLKTTLGLGYWKTIHILRDMIGHDHPMIMKMESHCAKHWKTQFEVKKELLESTYDKVLKSIETGGGIEQKVAVLYDYTYAVSCGKYIPQNVQHLAIRLRELTAGWCFELLRNHNLQYTTTTRAFAFANELLATYHLETWTDHRTNFVKEHDRNQSYQYMDEAIKTLRHGDIDCRVRAACLSKRLALWRQNYCGPKKSIEAKANEQRAQEEVRRTKELRSQIHKIPISLAKSPIAVSTDRGGSENNRWRRKHRKVRDAFWSKLSEDLSCVS